MKNLFLPFLLIFFNGFGQSIPQYSSKKNILTEVNQPVDIIFESKEEHPLEVNFEAIFIDQQNHSKKILGFYAGENHFIIRFNPELTGIYQFKTKSKIKLLNDLEGEVIVEPSKQLNKKPLVKIDSDNPQRFQYKNGESYFPIAFEMDWFFALDFPKNENFQESKSIVKTIKDHGFNQVVMNVYANKVGWPLSGNIPEKYQFSNPGYSIFKGTNDHPDFTDFNFSFFNNLDQKIQLLHENGIVAHLMIYVWNKKVNWPTMYSKEDNQFFDYIIKRYQAFPNIIWDVSKEALDYGRCDIPYINERIQRIRSLDSYQHLVTVHDYEYCSREPSKVDFISVQNWRSDLYTNSIETSLAHPNQPIMNIEHGGYEKGPFKSFVGNYVDPKICLERNYQAVFAGVYSTYYWQNTSWDVIIYDIFSRENPYEKPKFEYYQFMRKLFSTINFNELVAYKPKLTINSRLGNDNFSTSGYALTNNHGKYLYFVPKENDFINIVIPKPARGKLKISYFNIFTGELIEESADYALFKSFSSPWKGESFVLIIEED